MENVVYNELRARGYSVDVGVVGKRAREEGRDVRRQLEVDFVANRDSDRIYIQSALEMRTSEKAAQEKAPCSASTTASERSCWCATW